MLSTMNTTVAQPTGEGRGTGGPGPHRNPIKIFLQTIKPVHCNYQESEEFNRG